MIAGYLILCAIMAAKFFARVIVLWLYREPQPQKNQKSPHQRPQTPLAENLNPKNPIQDSNPITQTTINEQKREKRIKKNSEKENVVCQLERRFQIHQHALLGRLFFDKKSLNHRLSYPQNLDEALLTTICCSIVTNQFYAEQSTPTKCCLKHITLFATQIEKKIVCHQKIIIRIIMARSKIDLNLTTTMCLGLIRSNAPCKKN